MITSFKKSILAGLVLSASALASADEAKYFVVVPVGPSENIATFELQESLLSHAIVSKPYSFDLKRFLHTERMPYFTTENATWSVAGGRLPAGLQLNKDGTIVGTPTEPGLFDVRIRASYKRFNGEADYELLSLRFLLKDADLPTAVVGDPYVGFDLTTVAKVEGDPAFDAKTIDWRIVEGTLPAGLVLSSDGRISGTPTVTGSSAFKVMGTYQGVEGKQSYSITTNQITVGMADRAIDRVMTGQSVSIDFSNLATTAGDPYFDPAKVTYSAAGLPPGVSITASGVVQGIPTAAGIYTPTVTVDYKGRKASKAYTMPVGGYTHGYAREDGYVTLSAPAGMLIRNVIFASFGTPGGSGPFNYWQSGCHAGNSMSIANATYVGKQSASLRAHISVFGDPCGKTTKGLAVSAEFY